MTLLILLCIVVVTALVHEGGHALVALWVGWPLRGIVVRWYGVGLKVEVVNPDDLWKVAAGGLVTTTLLTAVCFALASVSVYFWVAFVLNAVLLVANLIPIRLSDGGYLWRAARDRAHG